MSPKRVRSIRLELGNGMKSRLKQTIGILLSVISMSLFSVAHAATAWQQLSPAEQTVLQQHRGNWDQLPEQRRQELRRRAARIENMSPAQRQRLEQRREKFQQLPEAERQALKERWRNMTPAERKAAKEQWNK